MLKKLGFTLIEFIVVIILLGILSAYVFIQPLTTVTLESEAQKVASDIRYTQSLAMTKGERFRFVIVTTSTYQIMNSTGTPILNPEGVTTTTLVDGITFGTLTNLPNSLVSFDGKGIPYTTNTSPGTKLLVDGSIPLIKESDTKTVVITPDTGRVTVQ